MSLPPGFLDELRGRLTLSDIVGRKVSWDRRRSNPAKGDYTYIWLPRDTKVTKRTTGWDYVSRDVKVHYYRILTVAQRFDIQFKDLLKDKEPTAQKWLDLAEWALQHGLVDEVPKLVNSAGKIDPKHRAVQAFQKVHPAVGKPVISINTIEAGVAHNVVPGECHITIDRRLIPGETKDSVVAEIRASLDGVAAEDPDFKYTMTVDPDGGFIPANITEESSPLVAAIQESIRTVTGQEPEYFVAWAGATDGRFYRQAGIDTVGYGPGGENAHGANEAGFVDDLVTQARVYVETVTRLLGA